MLALQEHHLAAVGRNRRRNGGRREARRVFGFPHLPRFALAGFQIQLIYLAGGAVDRLHVHKFWIGGPGDHKVAGRHAGNFFRRAFAGGKQLRLSIMNDNDGSSVRRGDGPTEIVLRDQFGRRSIAIGDVRAKALALLLAAGAAFFLRKPPGVASSGSASAVTSAAHASSTTFSYAPGPLSTASGGALLNALKEELFAIETEKINGTITPADYATVKSALEVVLKRALNRK